MSTESEYSRKNPFPAKLLVNRRLSLEGSEKETRHYEICLAGSGLNYEVGDSLGLFPSNCPRLVDEIIQALGLSGDEPVPTPAGNSKPLRAALIEDYAITAPTPQFLKLVAERAGNSAPLLNELLQAERKEELAKYIYGMETIDFLLQHPSVKISPEELVKCLRRLVPRLYSIASSLKAHPDQVHLTVATVRYQSHGRTRFGVASTFLADRISGEARIPVFVHTAKGFRLPEDGVVPVIMVGPGTGVAPFRAFLQERKATGASGKNWLFFGEQRAKTDFLYQEEFETLAKEGVLNRFDTAFSRDQAQKVYVQHRLLENAAEVWKWLQEGAHFFVCGDAERMAKDVDVALHKIVETEGGKSAEEAAAYVEALKKEKRYKRDVY